MPMPERTPATTEDEHAHADDDAVDDEDVEVVPLEVGEHEPDGGDAADGGGDHADGERHGRAGRQAVLGHLEPLEGGRAADDRDAHEERVARGRLAVEAQEQAGHHRDAGARDAREQRQRLRDADEQGVEPGEGLEVAVELRDVVDRGT